MAQHCFLVAGPSAYIRQWPNEFFILVTGPKFARNGPTMCYSCWAISISPAVVHWIFYYGVLPQACPKWADNILYLLGPQHIFGSGPLQFLFWWLAPNFPARDQQHFIVAGPSAYLWQWATTFFILVDCPKFAQSEPTTFYSCGPLNIVHAAGHLILDAR